MEHRLLGASGIAVSVVSLGSWLTFERMPREQGLEVMAAARHAGVDFLDDARYDDPTGTAPLRTGWSEVVFGELFRAAGWERDAVVVANKLWFEFWPQESPAAELDGSLGRMRFDHLDLLYCAAPPEGLTVAELVGVMGELVASGKVRAWGVLNWPAVLLAEAVREAEVSGLPGPCAAQLPYNVARREVVEDGELVAVLAGGVSVVASAVLAGGALSGKYAAPAARGRLAEQLAEGRLGRVLAIAEQLGVVAGELGTTAAALAIAFAAANPAVASVLLGATSGEQVEANVAALALLDQLGRDELLACLAGIG